jgi:hypothetical protein
MGRSKKTSEVRKKGWDATTCEEGKAKECEKHKALHEKGPPISRISLK